MTEDQAIYVLGLQVNESLRNKDNKIVLGVVKNILRFLFYTMTIKERIYFIDDILDMSLEVTRHEN